MKFVCDKEIDGVLRVLERQGWRIERARRHVKVYPPDRTKPMVVVSCTAGDHRSARNTFSDLRRSGANITGRGR